MDMSVGQSAMSPDTAIMTLPESPLPNATRHRLVIGLAGWSGSGKTTLAEKLISALTATGLNVATIKHAHHRFEADVPGKDSHRHRMAGAGQVLVSSQHRSVLFTEHANADDRPLDELLGALAPADIVLVEGFKREPIPKIEIFRHSVEKPPLYPDDEWIIAIASDDTAMDTGTLPLLDLNIPADVAGLIARLATER